LDIKRRCWPAVSSSIKRLLDYQEQSIHKAFLSLLYRKMQLLSIVGVMALVPAVLSSPVTDFKEIAVRADDRGNQTVAGLGARKQEVVAAGGNTRDLAIAMLETLVPLSSDSHIAQTADKKQGHNDDGLHIWYVQVLTGLWSQ
jgi:hypothetical protein